MSSIRNISASTPMPVDLAKHLGTGGIAELLSVLWRGYDELHKANCITSDMSENTITQEWALWVQSIWYSENRAARIAICLAPATQYEDCTLAKTKGSPPTIDFCFRSWDLNASYFGAECKNLYDHDKAHIERYVSTGVRNYTSGRYGSKSSVSSLVGYILSGKIPEIVDELKNEMVKTSPRQNITRDMSSIDPQYKSVHLRTWDSRIITIYHLFFDFTV